MSKYASLTTHLLEQDHSQPWRASFAEIERVIDAPLPESARCYQAWWANQSGKGHSQAFSWACVGWRTGEVDLENETVTFRYVGDELISVAREQRKKSKGDESEAISIDEAKRRLALTFGVLADQIEIIIKG